MPTSSNILCGCGRFMRVKKNSVTVEELTDDQRSYKLWDADLFECVECGVEIIAGFGRAPIAEHYQPTYAAVRERLAPIYPGRCQRQTSGESTILKRAQMLRTCGARKGRCKVCDETLSAISFLISEVKQSLAARAARGED